MVSFYLTLAQIKKFILSCFFALSLGSWSADVCIGTMSGPETELMKVVKAIALQDYGTRIKLVEFDDYSLLNTALNDGGLDANIFQHASFLKDEIKDTNYALTAIGQTFAYPMGVYTHKFTHLRDIPVRAVVGVPSDTSNQSRALRLLAEAGLIQLDIDAGEVVTVDSIRYNPKSFTFETRDAAKLAQGLREELDVAVLNTNYAVIEGLSAKRDALFIEKDSKPYVNLIVVREADRGCAMLQQIARVFQEDAVITYAHALFEGQAIPVHDGGEGGIRTRGRL